MLRRMSFTLDHVGIVSREMAGMRAAFHALGFFLTEPDELMGAAADGTRRSLGQASCHAVLPSGYIELSAVHSSDPAHHLASYLRTGPGLHILALGTDDIAAANKFCATSGLPCTAVSHATREIHYGDRHGAARFEWFMLAPAAAPEGLVCVVHNHTPELVYQSAVTAHANGATRLAGLAIACVDPAATARRYERLLGAVAARHASAQGSEWRISILGGELVFVTADAAARRFGVRRGSDGDHFAAILVAVADLGVAAALLNEHGVPYQAAAGRLILAAAHAGGAGLELLQD